MVIKGFNGKKLIIKAKLCSAKGAAGERHQNIELWDGKTRLCNMHISKDFIHIFRTGNLNCVFVSLNNPYVNSDEP